MSSPSLKTKWLSWELWISSRDLPSYLLLLYGEFHPGRELTAIEVENFWLAVKPISVWINLQDFCAFVYVSIFLGKRSFSILLTSFTC